MKNVKRSTFERKVRDGDWEVVFEENQFHRVEVRNVRTNVRFTVTVV